MHTHKHACARAERPNTASAAAPVTAQRSNYVSGGKCCSREERERLQHRWRPEAAAAVPSSAGERGGEEKEEEEGGGASAAGVNAGLLQQKDASEQDPIRIRTARGLLLSN